MVLNDCRYHEEWDAISKESNIVRAREDARVKQQTESAKQFFSTLWRKHNKKVGC